MYCRRGPGHRRVPEHGDDAARLERQEVRRNAPGRPEQGPGKVSVSGFEGELEPPPFVARRATVYVPSATPEKAKLSVRPSGMLVVSAPVTSSTNAVGAPPSKVGFQERATSEPLV